MPLGDVKTESVVGHSVSECWKLFDEWAKRININKDRVISLKASNFRFNIV